MLNSRNRSYLLLLFEYFKTSNKFTKPICISFNFPYNFVSYFGRKVERALHASYNNPYTAVQYLVDGIPSNLDYNSTTCTNPPATRQGGGGGGGAAEEAEGDDEGKSLTTSKVF